jgi:hypothetical protein
VDTGVYDNGDVRNGDRGFAGGGRKNDLAGGAKAEREMRSAPPKRRRKSGYTRPSSIKRSCTFV